ncbi:MAG TPA: hypothetical protein GXX14_03880 [Clostridiaceae bacterium]|nr:hypothetical protein [Clostridiaceae bacterium]
MINSVWCESLPCEEDGLPHPVFSKDNYWYKWYRDALLFFAHEGNGRYYTLPTFGNHSTDTLGLIRGIQNLMLDIVDRPEWVRAQDRQIADILIDIINERFLDVEKNKVEGYINDASMWAPKRPWGLHCDISYCISTEVFKYLFWESQIRIADMTEYAYFHVDGVGVLNHLDLILSERRIRAIQWLPGDGRNYPMQWIDVYRKVQEKGRSLQIYAEYDDVLPILKEIKPNGVCINVINCPNEDEGYRIVEEVEKFYVDSLFNIDKSTVILSH